MNRTKTFFYNSMSTALLQVIILIVGLITPRIMLQYYGSEINGLVSSICQFVSYFSLVEAGLAGASTYALYKPLASGDHKSINGIIVAAKIFYIQSGYVFVLLTLVLAFFYPCFIKSERLSPISIGLLVIIIGINGTLEFFTLAKYRVLLTADQKTYVISITSMIQIFLNTAIIVVLSISRVNIITLRVVALLAFFTRSFLLLIYVKIHYNYLNYKEIPNYKALNKRWSALYLQILGSTQSGAPIILATIFTSLQNVSVYSIYNMVVGGINGVLSIFISGLSASFGNVLARDEKKTLQKAYRDFEFFYYSLITIIYGISMVTILPFIRIYTRGITDVNYDLPMVGFLFVLNGWLYNIKTPQGMLVISAGLYRETRVQSTIQTFIIIVLGSILAPVYGLVGILIASCISNIYRDIDLLIFIPHNVTNLPIKETALHILQIIVEMIVICVPLYFIKIDINNLLQWFLFASLIGIYSIVVVFIFGFIFHKEQMKSVIYRVNLMFLRR